MLKTFKKSFLILKNNLLFIQPFLLLLLILMTAGAVIANMNFYITPQKILLFISMVLLLIAFSAGWFYINKLGVLEYNETDSKDEITVKSVKNFKKFFEGVGLIFLKTLFSYLIVFLLYAACLLIISKLCLTVFGEPKLIYELPKLAKASSQAEVLNILNNLTDNDKIVFSSWVLTLNVAFSIVNFFCALYFTVNVFEKCNVFVSLWISIKFFIKNIFGSFYIVFFMFALYLILNLLSILLGTNSFSFVVLIILFTIYLNYYLLLVFCFYNEKTKDNSNNGTELIG